MRVINQETINKHVKWLTVVKQQEGKSLDLYATAKMLHMNNSIPAIARDLGLLEYDGTKILKVNYKNPEPILARKLIEYTYNTKRKQQENHLNDMAKILAPVEVKPKEVPVVEFKPTEVPFPDVHETPKPKAMKADKVEPKVTVKEEKPTKEKQDGGAVKRFTLRLFNVPIIGLEY